MGMAGIVIHPNPQSRGDPIGRQQPTEHDLNAGLQQIIIVLAGRAAAIIQTDRHDKWQGTRAAKESLEYLVSLQRGVTMIFRRRQNLEVGASALPHNAGNHSFALMLRCLWPSLVDADEEFLAVASPIGRAGHLQSSPLESLLDLTTASHLLSRLRSCGSRRRGRGRLGSYLQRWSSLCHVDFEDRN